MNRGPPALSSQSDDGIVETDIPARLDRLPWRGFHTRVVVALGITWILDGLEVTLAGTMAGALRAALLQAVAEQGYIRPPDDEYQDFGYEKEMLEFTHQAARRV